MDKKMKNNESCENRGKLISTFEREPQAKNGEGLIDVIEYVSPAKNAEGLIDVIERVPTAKNAEGLIDVIERVSPENRNNGLIDVIEYVFPTKPDEELIDVIEYVSSKKSPDCSINTFECEQALASPQVLTTEMAEKPAQQMNNQQTVSIEKCIEKTITNFAQNANGNIIFTGLLGFTPDDSGNVDRFLCFYGDIVLYAEDEKKFYLWNERFWEESSVNKVKKMMETVMKTYRDEAKVLRDSPNPIEKALHEHSKNSCNHGAISAAVNLLKSRCHITSDKFDNNTHLLNVKNGIIYLQKGTLLEHCKDLLLTHYVNVDYVPDTDASQSDFLQFLYSICCGDRQLMDYLQVVFGYAITGETREQVFFIMYGSGGNGKSTLINAVEGVVSDYVSHMSVETLMKSNCRAGAATPELAMTQGKRMVFTSELNSQEKLNEGKIKNLTGQGKITVRALRCMPVEFTPQFKIFIDTNHLPQIAGYDEAMVRRLRIIPFEATFRGENSDKFLPQRLQQESERTIILNWLVAGAVRYYGEGMPACYAVEKATIEYVNSADSVQLFLDECVQYCEGGSYSARELYIAFQRYCKVACIPELSEAEFAKAMALKGIKKKRTNKGNQYMDVAFLED